MILGRVAFSVVISPFGGLWVPVVSKFALGVAESEPVKSHNEYLQWMRIPIYSKITVKHAKHITHEKNKGGTHCQY